MNDESETYTLLSPDGNELQVPDWLHQRVIETEKRLELTVRELATMTRDRDRWKEQYSTRTQELRSLQERRRQANERKARRIARRMMGA